MKFSYHWLKEIAELSDTPEELAEFLTMRAFEVEEVKKSGEDWMLNIKVLPNRIADASGHIGMAREIAALKGTSIQNKVSGIKEDKKRKASDVLTVKIENPEDCPRYTARVIAGVRIGPSPAWMRARLEACGLQSINSIVDATNYVMLETGQPLHAFDYEKLGSRTETKKTILVRRAEKNERIETLVGKAYDLSPDILLITDGANPLAIAGIKGGNASGITNSSRTIIIESANFNPMRVRLASQKLKLKTDASYRFEHGMDPNQTLAALNRVSEIITQSNVAGGTILSGVIDVITKKITPSKILFSVSAANALLGTELPASFYRSAFMRLGCGVAKKARGAMIVTPPTIRRDLAIEEELIEEAGRILGYDNIPPQMPAIAARPAERNDERWWEERTRDILVGAGFTESMLSEFTSAQELGQFRLDPATAPELENPLSPETRYLVPRALIKYVVSAAENLRHFDNVRIFGIAKSFRAGKNGMVPGMEERKNLIMVFAEKGASGEDEFYQLKGAVEQLLESLGISDHWYDDVQELGIRNNELGIYHPYRMAEIKIGDEKIGVLGEIHPDILKNIKARARIAAAEIDMEKLTRLATNEAEYRPVGKYPAIVRDIAVIVPADTKTQDAENIISAAGGELLADTDLFDYFQDDALRAEAQKSLAFHLVFQSAERTLIDAEVDVIIKKIIAALEEKEWEVKK